MAMTITVTNNQGDFWNLDLADFADSYDLINHVETHIGLPCRITYGSEGGEKLTGMDCSETDLEYVWELEELLMDSRDPKAVIAFLDYTGDLEHTVEDFEEAYMGEWDSKEAYAEELVDSMGMLNDLPENLRYYFDYEAFARDLFIGNYTYWDGYVFLNL